MSNFKTKEPDLQVAENQITLCRTNKNTIHLLHDLQVSCNITQK